MLICCLPRTYIVKVHRGPIQAGRGDSANTPSVKGLFSRAARSDPDVKWPIMFAEAMSSLESEVKIDPFHEGTPSTFLFHKEDNKCFTPKEIAPNLLAFSKSLIKSKASPFSKPTYHATNKH